MAGSSLPLCYRKPFLEHDLHTPIEEAISIAYGGLDSYGFHGLEMLQCMVERRAGGEKGVVAVQCLEGDAVWDARDKGLWSGELAAAALARIENKGEGDWQENAEQAAVFLLEYADGFKAATLMLNGFNGWLKGWAYAARVQGEVLSSEFYLHGDPHPHFSFLSLNAQQLFLTGEPTYPVERTLLISGALEALLDSRYRGCVRVETPHLGAIAYRSYEQPPLRARRERPTGPATVAWRPERAK
jgi:hypothetical protein